MSQARNPSKRSSVNLKNIIVVYDYAYINGGVAKVAIQGAVGLSNKYHVCYFVAVGPICDELAKSNVEVKCLNINDINSGSRIKAIINGIWNVTAQREFKKLLAQYDAQDTIVHIHGWAKALSSSVVYASTKCGFKTVVTLHDYFTICPNGGLYNYQAIGYAMKENHTIQGIVIGDGELLEKYKEKYRNVTFVGWKEQEEVVTYMTNARALIFPSKWYEGSPLTTIEAMAVGLPCIVSDCSAAAEQIREGSGLVFQSGCVQDLKKKILFAENDSEWVGISPNLNKMFDRYAYSSENYLCCLEQAYYSLLRA